MIIHTYLPYLLVLLCQIFQVYAEVWMPGWSPRWSYRRSRRWNQDDRQGPQRRSVLQRFCLGLLTQVKQQAVPSANQSSIYVCTSTVRYGKYVCVYIKKQYIYIYSIYILSMSMNHMESLCLQFSCVHTWFGLVKLVEYEDASWHCDILHGQGACSSCW